MDSIYKQMNTIDDNKSLNESGWYVGEPDPDGSAEASMRAGVRSAEKSTLEKYNFKEIENDSRGWDIHHYAYKGNINGWEIILDKFTHFGGPNNWYLRSVDGKEVDQHETFLSACNHARAMRLDDYWCKYDYQDYINAFTRALGKNEKIVFTDGTQLDQDVSVTVKKK